MEVEYAEPDSNMNEIANRVSDMESQEPPKDFSEAMGYDEVYEDDDGGNNFRGGRGRGNFRGPPPGWMNGPPPMRFRGRGYGPGGPPMRGRGFFRGRGGPRYGPNGGPNFDNNWGPMGPPPPGMMGGPPPFGPPPGMMGPGGPMGPPPNMMGQPPPFGGPPGMPPPNMPQPELWVETKSEEGKSYYYHSRTRETTWTRPQESPTCKVVTQAEMEAMATAGQLPGMATQSMPMNGPMGGPPMGGPMGMMPMMGGMVPPGVAPPTGPGVPPFMNQPPPWVKEGKEKAVSDTASPIDGDEMPPGETAQSMQGPNGGMGGFGAPPWGPWGWNQPPPGQMQQMPEPVPQEVAPATPVPAKKEETVIPPELAVLAGEWSTHRAPDGRPYYYHSGRQESVWEKPKPLKEFEELQTKIALEKGEKPPKKIEKIKIDESKIEVIDVEAHAEAAAAAEAERRAAAERERERAEHERLDKERLDKERLDKEKEKAEKEKAKQDKSRPISSTPISGTPWCVVWTGDGRVFFYNPTAHSSVWERPAQLLGRADVDKAVSQPPNAVEVQRKEGATAAAAATTKPANGELKRSADSDSDDSDAEPAKKAKPEEGKKAAVIDLGKEAAIEAEVRAARERALLPLDQRLTAFRGMLAERDVSAFSTWEKELHKIVFDTRYLLLTSKERKQVFDKYVRERAEEERKEKKNRLQLKKTAYRQLMEEAKLHSKSSFTDFSSKHGRDDRFKGIDKPRDRETYFNEYIAEVRKKEKEEKEKKREQVKTEFINLLKEKAIDRHARWADAKKKVDTDPRYKAVESSTAREDYFREYCKIVKEERKKEKDGKEKERDRSSSKKEKKDKDRDKEKEKEKDKEKDKEGKEKKKKDKGEKVEPEQEIKQPTPPPDQWAEILGIPGEDDSTSSLKCKGESSTEKSDTEKSSSPEKEMLSPKQLRSSKKEQKKTAIKSPPKKRKDFKSPEPEKKVTRKNKVEKKVEKTKKKRKSEKE